jgi:hypothetical protein
VIVAQYLDVLVMTKASGRFHWVASSSAGIFNECIIEIKSTGKAVSEDNLDISVNGGRFKALHNGNGYWRDSHALCAQVMIGAGLEY